MVHSAREEFDAAPTAAIESVDRDASAKGQDSGPVITDEEQFEAA